MRRSYAIPLLMVYVLSVLAVTVPPDFSPDPTDYLGETAWTPLRLTPFEVDAPSFLLNIVMFVPFGILLTLCLPRVGRFWPMLWCALGASTTIELIQWVENLTLDGRRTVDVNDLVANVVGALLGLGLLRLARP